MTRSRYLVKEDFGKYKKGDTFIAFFDQKAFLTKGPGTVIWSHVINLKTSEMVEFMREEEVVYPNDTTRQIRRMMVDLENWSDGNQACDQRHTKMLITKLEEAELISLRIVHEQPE